jgi:hypothetical protein
VRVLLDEAIQEELEAGAVAVVERERVRLRSLAIEPTWCSLAAPTPRASVRLTDG